MSRDYARSSQPATEVYVAGSDTANPAKKIANGLMRGYDYASEDGTLAARLVRREIFTHFLAGMKRDAVIN